MTLDSFIEILTKHNKFLYHFTDNSNISSIRSTGLLSKAQIERAQIQGVKFNGNDWSQNADQTQGLDNYVNLSFTDNHPMIPRVLGSNRDYDLKHLKIAPEILKDEDVKITLGVANSAGIALLSPEEALSEMDLQVLYNRLDWKDPEVQQRRQKAEKYEVLVPNNIPTRLITFP